MSGKVQVVPLLLRGNLSANVKIINKIHIVIVRVLLLGRSMGTIVLALLTVFGWMQKGQAARCTAF